MHYSDGYFIVTNNNVQCPICHRWFLKPSALESHRMHGHQKNTLQKFNFQVLLIPCHPWEVFQTFMTQQWVLLRYIWGFRCELWYIQLHIRDFYWFINVITPGDSSRIVTIYWSLRNSCYWISICRRDQRCAKIFRRSLNWGLWSGGQIY